MINNVRQNMIKYIGKKNIIPNLFLTTFIVISLFPMFWMLISSFKSPSEILKIPPQFFIKPSLINFIAIFVERPFLHYTINSIIVALTTTILCMILGTPAAYGFSKFKFHGQGIIFLLIISSRLFPPVSFLVPFTVMFTKLGLIDTRLVLIITCLFSALPFFLWLLVGFFNSIPSELIDAARIDGCDKIDTFFKVSLPLAKTGMASGAIMVFIMSWNEFMFALAFTRINAKTLTVGLFDFFMDDFVAWNKVMAASLYSAIPAIIFIIFFQRYLVKGIISGSVKG